MSLDMKHYWDTKNRNAGNQRIARGASAFLVLLCSVILGTAQAAPDKEYQVKAAVIMNFALYTYWPVEAFANEKTPVNICLFKKDPFGSYIDDLVLNRKYKSEAGVQRNLSVWRINDEGELADCHIVFIPDNGVTARHVQDIAAKNRLIVGETRQFTREGGQMSVYMEGDNVRFSVNLDAIADVGLSISSQLLRLAEIVKNN
jgi:hypothetical protein